MTEKTKSILAFIFMAAGLVFISAWFAPPDPPIPHFIPAAPKIEYTTNRTGVLEVAKVFGRSAGCSDANPELVEITNTAAIHAGLDPRLVAATIAVESGCNSFAVSSRGALGLMQIMPKVWGTTYDFESVNLLNPEENVRVGTEILAKLTQQHGVYEAVRRYQGLGEGCPSCDGQYTEKIMKLAGRYPR